MLHTNHLKHQNYRIPVAGVGVPDVLTPDADDSNDAACVDVERGAGNEEAGAGCVAVGRGAGDEGPGAGCAVVGVMLDAGDAADAVVNHVVDGVDVETVVCVSGGETMRLVQPNYCLWH